MLRILLWLTAYLLVGLGFAIPAGAQTCPTPYMTVYAYLTPGGLLAGEISPAPSGQSNFPATRYTYDPNGRLQKVETGYLSSCPGSQPPSQWGGFQVGKAVTYSYDANGNKTLEEVTGSYNSAATTTNVTQYSYDSYDRLACTAVRMTLSASLPASACTPNPSPGSDGRDRITENSYDYLNRLTQVQKAVGTPNPESYATYTYTADSLQQYITDADGNESKLTYDGFDRLAYWYFPSKTTAGSVDTSDYEAYGYDANGNRTSLRKRDGESISYQYDTLNRMSLKQVPTASEDVYYGYDLRGLMTYALFGSTSGPGITNAYDGFGRLTSTTSTMGGISRTVSEGHDNDGDRTSVTFPDSNYFDYDYDGLDRLSDVRENGSTTVVSESYNAYGLSSSEIRGGITSSYDYEPAERPQTWTDNFPAPAADVTTSLGYSPADEIITKTVSNDSYVYTSYVDGTTNYSANGLNQYTSVASATFTYDANGNLTYDGTTNYSYDSENRVVSASGGHAATLTYDPLGRLFQIATSSATTQFLYDGDQMVAEYNASGTLQRRYVHGSGTDEPLLWYEGGGVSSTTRRSLQVDYQGSIDSVADASGNMIGIDSYDEYGRPGANNIGSFQYTGQVWLPELGIYYYKARMYDPRLGRFLQTDPVGYKDDLDLYAYVGNDPLDRTDPTGEISWDDFLGDLSDWLDTASQAANANPELLGPLYGPELEDASVALRGLAEGSEATGEATEATVNLADHIPQAEDEGIVYVRTNKADPTEKPYVGRARSESRYAARQKEHGRANPSADYEFKEVARAKRGRPLREAEQREITKRGGPTNKGNPNGGTSNKRNEIAVPIVRICYGSVCD